MCIRLMNLQNVNNLLEMDLVSAKNLVSAGPFGPPPFHHFKTDIGDFWPKPEGMYIPIYSTDYFYSKICHIRTAEIWTVITHLQTYRLLKFDSFI